MDNAQVRSTQCTVEIVTPGGVRVYYSPADTMRDLLQVQTNNDIAQAAGTFRLTFAPRTIDGRTYDQIVPLGSLVTIKTQDALYPVSEADSVIMLGRTEDQSLQEDFSRAVPRRQVLISGRSMAGLFLDATLFYHPGLAKQGDTGALTEGAHLFNMQWATTLTEPNQNPVDAIANVLIYFLGVPSRRPGPGQEGPLATELSDQDAAEHLMAVDPRLSQVQAQAQVIRAREHQDAGKVVGSRAEIPQQAPANGQGSARFVVQGLVPGEGQLINLQLPGRTVADVLDLNNDQWNLFEDGVTVPNSPSTTFTNSLWNYLHIFVDPLFQEFFTRIEGGVVKIHFRSKPFLKRHVLVGTRFRSDDPTCPTTVLDPTDLLGSQLRRQSANVYNVFLVLPLQSTTNLKDNGGKIEIFPVALNDPEHPSYTRRYGMRVLEHRSIYLSGLLTVPETPQSQRWEPVIETSKRWGEIASYWYGYAPEMYAGLLTVRGSPIWNCGHRLLMRGERGEREAYIEGVSHSYDYQTGHYLTQLRVTRMWYLDGPIDDRGTIVVTETRPPATNGHEIEIVPPPP